MILTSESVTPGHPDKICDQISDAILDAHLAQDPDARVAVETLASSRGIVIAGEITSRADVSPSHIAREVLRDIGYTAESGIDPTNVEVQNHLVNQSPEISQAVNRKQLGAGDQGMMFGYATNETETYMPAPLELARALTDRLVYLRESGNIPWLRPDGKAQVTVRYEDDVPVAVDAVVVSAQHAPTISLSTVRHVLENEVVVPVLNGQGFEDHGGLLMHLNPAGAWNMGGPAADTGLTGRKIIVDTYGGAARHGGGAFSGKDPSKVDRSAAYAARHAAKWLVKAGHADRVEVQLSYAIGVSEPVSISVFTKNGQSDTLAKYLMESFDFTPQGIIDRFLLTRPIYRETAARGHFGHANFPWEQ